MTRVAARMMAGAAGASEAPYVRFTTTGATFAPAVECGSGTVRWTCEETAQVLTGTSPTFSWGSAATRHVRMSVAGGAGLAGIVTVNLGYLHTDDAGTYGPTLAGGLQPPNGDYDKSAQACSAVSGINLCTGLKNFLAANGNLAGTLDFTGCADLEYVECYSADVQAVTLTGCTSLIRLCLESCNLTSLDLNPVASCLYDLRSAAQQGGALTFAALSADMAHLYHFCVRDQDVTGFPSASRLPAITQLWCWNCGITGALTVAGPLQSLMAYSNPGVTSVDLSGCPGQNYMTIWLAGCGLTQGAVDDLIDTLDGFDTSYGGLDLTGNAVPSIAGVAASDALTGRAWTVSLETGGVNSDNFERADVTGIGNVGNGWYGWCDADADISSGDLVYTSGSSYRMLLNPGDSLAADYTVTAVVPDATLGSFFGIAGRVRYDTYPAGDGVRLLFGSGRADITIGDASQYNANNVTVNTDAGFPASWTLDQDHTIAMKMTGTLIEIFLDGQTIRGFYATVTTNATLRNTSYGICGVGGGRHWKSIAAAA